MIEPSRADSPGGRWRFAWLVLPWYGAVQVAAWAGLPPTFQAGWFWVWVGTVWASWAGWCWACSTVVASGWLRLALFGAALLVHARLGSLGNPTEPMMRYLFTMSGFGATLLVVYRLLAVPCLDSRVGTDGRAATRLQFGIGEVAALTGLVAFWIAAGRRYAADWDADQWGGLGASYLGLLAVAVLAGLTSTARRRIGRYLLALATLLVAVLAAAMLDMVDRYLSGNPGSVSSEYLQVFVVFAIWLLLLGYLSMVRPAS